MRLWQVSSRIFLGGLASISRGELQFLDVGDAAEA
jgi:hypothetical protein